MLSNPFAVIANRGRLIGPYPKLEQGQVLGAPRVAAQRPVMPPRLVP